MAEVLDQELILTIKKYLEEVSKHYVIDKAFLFGSFAQEKANKDSDIDLAIVSSSFSGNRFFDNVELGKLTWRIETRIEPIAFTPQDFDELMFAEQIKKSCIEIPMD